MTTFFGHYSESDLRAAMSKAIDEAARLGRDGLRRKYGFERAKKYVAVAAGHHFDSKALVAAAAKNLEPPVTLTSENSFGGKATTRVLHACGVPWINTDRLTHVPELDSNANGSDLLDGDHPKYWWVNQNDNYSTVIKEGSLWAPDLRRDGNPGHKDWTALRFMTPGDIVFHYASQQFRALSVIVSAGAQADRPPGYPADDYLHGTLVLLEPRIVDMEVGLDVLKEIFRAGVGPMNSTGNPGRVYTAQVPRSIGDPLARYLSGGSISSRSFAVMVSKDSQDTSAPLGVNATDIAGSAYRRAEQGYLRQALLASFGNQCAICGRVLPENLLIAAHIKPRSECSEEERLDFRAAAMLACSLGCDALFEFGYVTVDDRGLVRATATNEPELRNALKSIDGLPCLAFSETTAPNFEFHHQRHGVGL
ncbi:HNH endonuclease signature motif containing protein [Sinomonas sp. JGH33]|uniref:HNH endonuclease signature motif containing protein n=1 Tax=Sinomonas terricola TaxID=3110330 RepID=A0ABU5T2Y8_9MICC|nr:HNH endonuclease signature motif containing protein [Sinomonas sp. JGH33]MEA5454037.1 HNH endonuclease signature motif containing protein [Sinomonas sp. JGH33]